MLLCVCRTLTGTQVSIGASRSAGCAAKSYRCSVRWWTTWWMRFLTSALSMLDCAQWNACVMSSSDSCVMGADQKLGEDICHTCVTGIHASPP